MQWSGFGLLAPLESKCFQQFVGNVEHNCKSGLSKRGTPYLSVSAKQYALYTSLHKPKANDEQYRYLWYRQAGFIIIGVISDPASTECIDGNVKRVVSTTHLHTMWHDRGKTAMVLQVDC